MTGSAWLMNLRGRPDRRARWLDVAGKGDLDQAVRVFRAELTASPFQPSTAPGDRLAGERSARAAIKSEPTMKPLTPAEEADDMNPSQDPGRQPCGSRDDLAATATAPLALKPCPFCAKPPVVRRVVEEYPADETFPAGEYDAAHMICCDVCGLEVREEYRAEAAARWNQRKRAISTNKGDDNAPA